MIRIMVFRPYELWDPIHAVNSWISVIIFYLYNYEVGSPLTHHNWYAFLWHSLHNPDLHTFWYVNFSRKMSFLTRAARRLRMEKLPGTP